MRKTPILVTGIHRSGSTFLGKMLTLNRKIAYIQEPFNRYYGLDIIDARFKYLTQQNVSDRYRQALNDLINLRKASYNITSLTEAEKVIVSRREIIQEMIDEVNLKNVHKYIGKILFRTEGQLRFDVAKRNPFIKRILLKDPEACLASHFLHARYNMDVVILVRHPLSFAASLKRVGWRFDFDNFLSQTQLMQDYLEEYRTEMESMTIKNTVIEEAGLLWNCVYKVLDDFIKKNPSFIVIKHRRLAEHPVQTFKYLYEKLGLEYTPQVNRKIMDHTSKKNPDQPPNNKVHQLKRNSVKIPDDWKQILTDREATYIKEKTKEIANIFY